ncbi:tetraacyldisaccharide 4'-kinase [Candidatus Nucleicultrix amoebiphila]|jgi:tetraacyldisaccharide 4'-kinase|uniref:Tetraacyldisaccharide 4'-kinase n=1 Tax=Candidatus Nucleicultrix amoebiphila FS5 TaxID=1414854 RepID=A0A1W6N3Z4_9PROT|nr:tetraacyldisaccharide 4'-kinase [Candidatus Nucleicultrix amoebiphila]ARN84506.1 hypothetical protein GQ61_03280 [Candidatus Nucleicultrix amoebiphila FS5]
MKAPKFWHKRDSIRGLLLIPIAIFYKYFSTFYRSKIKASKLPIPVICIGNVVIGGAGKTPVAIAIYDLLRNMGIKPHFLTRGYKGKMRGPLLVDPYIHTFEDVGDEPLLLAKKGPTWVSADRVEGAKSALANGAEVIIMDDGFQNPYLHKDINILVIDGSYGLGSGRLFPAGPLRESLASGLSRAQAVIIVGEGWQHQPFKIPTFYAHAQLDPNILKTLKTLKLCAFAGIGNPEKFFTSLRNAGLHVLDTFSFSDHHPYIPEELNRLVGGDLTVVTTTKDYVRIPEPWSKKITPISMDIKFNDPHKLMKVLERVLI